MNRSPLNAPDPFNVFDVAFVSDNDSRLKFVWVSNYYDGPLQGLCTFTGVWCSFELFSDENAEAWEYVLKRLTTWQLFKWRIRQRTFELFMGYHATWDKTGKRGKEYRRYRYKWQRDLLFWIYYKVITPHI